MNTSIAGRLILKDLYLAWPVIAGALVLGSATIALALFGGGPIAFYVGSVSFICVLIMLNVLLVSRSVAQEKKDKTAVFVLSLPVSTTQYAVTKMISNLTAFLVPFTLIGVATLLLMNVTAMPKGLMPLTAAVMTYVLFYFCVFLAVALAADSPMWNSIVIVIGNVSINFLIAWLLNIPSVATAAKGTAAVWSGEILATLVAGAAGSVLVLAVALLVILRKKDFL